jgi:hypothetical protein
VTVLDLDLDLDFDSRLLEKSLRKLLKPLVSVFGGAFAEGFDMRAQGCVSPIKARRLFGLTSDTFARRFKQDLGGSGFVAGIVTRRQAKIPAWFAGFVAIVVHKRA